MAKDKDRFSNNIQVKNRRAGFEYQFLEKYIAGLVLKGTEIKSIREGKANLQDSFCIFIGEELYVREMHISPFGQASFYNHDLKRERKLLLSKKELAKLKSKSEEKGLAIVPTRLFINDRGLAKLEIALAKGKKLHDKRENIREKDVKREMERMKYP